MKYKIKIEKSAPNRRQTITRVRCFSAEILLQSYAEEGAGTPFVLINCYLLIIEDGIVHHEGGTGKITRREIIDDGRTFVENHVETHVLGLFAHIIHSHVVAVVDHEGGEHGEVEKPFFTKHPVVAIASTNADVADFDTHIRCIGILFFQFTSIIVLTSERTISEYNKGF